MAQLPDFTSVSFPAARSAGKGIHKRAQAKSGSPSLAALAGDDTRN